MCTIAPRRLSRKSAAFTEVSLRPDIPVVRRDNRSGRVLLSPCVVSRAEYSCPRCRRDSAELPLGENQDRYDVPSTKKPQKRGRPLGGGHEPEQAKEAMLDAAERLMSKVGYRAATMEAIAGEAGFTRTMIYRHFPTRNDLLEALLKRGTIRQMAEMLARLGPEPDLATLVVEANVVVATELVRDPLFAVFAERTDTGNVAQLLVNAQQYTDFLEPLFDQMVKADKAFLRKGIRSSDAAKFLVGTAMAFLLGVVPGADDPDQVRRYVTAFILPAIMASPPEPGPVF
jgi:AcrR family transcriptional regulator